MKLRNKKTGEIGQIGYVATNDGAIIVEDISGSEYPFSVISNYKTLTKLNEDWEDYKPAEPLIKDEKIRKAVRAWAEANDYGDDEEYQFEDFHTGWHSWSLEHHQNGDYNEIHFNGGIDFKRVTHQSYYTIDELCGEEEE